MDDLEWRPINWIAFAHEETRARPAPITMRVAYPPVEQAEDQIGFPDPTSTHIDRHMDELGEVAMAGVRFQLGRHLPLLLGSLFVLPCSERSDLEQQWLLSGLQQSAPALEMRPEVHWEFNRGESYLELAWITHIRVPPLNPST